MKPHPRIRKTVKWGGLLATLSLITSIVASKWCYVEYVLPGCRKSILCERGALEVLLTDHGTFAPRSGWSVRRNLPGDGFTWWCGWSQSGPMHGFVIGEYFSFSLSDLGVVVLLWPIATFSLAITAAARRLDALARRRARLNLCRNCNYDRTGLTAGALCPECGAAAP